MQRDVYPRNLRHVYGRRRRVPLMRHGLLACVAVSAVLTNLAQAQTVTPQTLQTSGKAAPAALNDVIVTGTRQNGKTARDSPTPIDVISGAALQATGQVSLRDALAQVSPSVARVAFGGDTSQLTDELTIHGLSPDHVLVLVNGKRRHNTANIHLDAGANQGSTGVDIDMIPVSAIDHIEVLRDGDSAQYGSDAIAGVINIILKSADHGGSIQTDEGQYYAGDGFSRDLAANAGTSLGDNGFLNLSGEYAGQDHTFRSGPDPRTDELDNKILGDPSANRELLEFNAGYFLNNATEFYGFGTYGHRDGDSYENYRLPSELTNPATSLPVFPGGFSPQETISENDFSLTGGVKGKNFFGWAWDLSSTFGADYDNIGMINSANTSYYATYGFTPTTFHLEDLTNKQWTNNLDFTRPFLVPVLPAPLTVSWGVEHRLEIYQIGTGDSASQYGSGAQALPGLTSLSAGSHFRNVEAGYVDLATKIVPAWQIDLAGRFEHYSDVGNTENGKLSTRYDFNPQVALRASVGTGFQAPSLAEEYFTNLNVSPTSASGQLAANSAIAKSLGSVPLKPERSTNFDAGIVLNPLPTVNFTADAYEVDIQDRVVDGGTATGAPAIAALESAGFTLTQGLSEVSTNYFTNGADTRTRGVDLTGSYLQNLPDLGTINWGLGANYNDTEITKVATNAAGQPELNQQQSTQLTDTTPKFKILLGADWQDDRVGFGLHETIYGPTSDELTYFGGPNAYSSTVFAPFHNPVEVTTDIEGRYALTRHLQLAVGAVNLFDAQPKKVPLINQYLGTKYDGTSSQISIDGGMYYIRARYVF